MEHETLIRCLDAVVRTVRRAEREPGDHYHNKATAARIWRETLEILREKPEEYEEAIRIAEDRHKRACYVGD